MSYRRRLVSGAMLAAAIGSGLVPASAADQTAIETILFIRHAEKPAAGLGQLSCKGLNRALALADRFPAVDAIFAPDPSGRKDDGDGSFDYVRPLATIEPTAIRLGLPVHADFGFFEQDKLMSALKDPAYKSNTVLVAWEHHTLQALVPKLLYATGGDPTAVPKWKSEDFDSIWKVEIARTPDGHTSSTFTHEQERLDGQPEACPTSAPPK